MLNTSYTQWENSNTLRRFPFADNASLKDDTGMEMPECVISDISVKIPYDAAIDPDEIYVSCIKISKTFISVSVACGNNALLTAFSGTDTPYTPVAMTSIMHDTSGYVSFGDIGPDVTPGIYRFSSAEQSGLESRVISVFKPPAVTSFYDSRHDKTLTGIVTFNIPDIIVPEITGDYASGYTVKFNLTPEGNDVLGTKCNVGTSENVCGTPVIKSINGVRPNAAGEIALRFL